MNQPRISWLLPSLLIFCYPGPGFAQEVSLQSLLREMTSREMLARFPSPAYTCRQASSYDRDSVSPDNQTTWYANWDRSQFIRTEVNQGRTEHVLLEADGPGAVVRFWATWHGPGGGTFSNGTLRIYLDHAPKPAIEGPISKILDQGQLAGPPLAEGVSPKTPYAQRGHNLYLPIPYASHCKITYATHVLVDRGAQKGEALYYQINYRTYEPDTRVETFSSGCLRDAKALIATTNQHLAAGRRDDASDWSVVGAAGELPAGEQAEPMILAGPGAIRSLQCRLVADDLQQALRSTVVEIVFDGEPAVWCPIGDFFGIGHQLRPHKTWYTHVRQDGLMLCTWVMPYQKTAIVTLHNLGTQPVRIEEGEIGTSPWEWDERSMHFHATWRQLHEVETRRKIEGVETPGYFDVNYVTIQGQGVYVGDTLAVMNGAAAWWGEGDEKIYVDDESFPSHFGTGTEDYYGYAWCRAESFSSPFHAQPEGGGNMTGGYSVNSRYRALDAIAFRQSLRFDMELWHWAETKMNYAPTTYWYARPGATCNVKPEPAMAALPIAKAITDLVPPLHVEGALEGESLQVLDKTGGVAEVQTAAPLGWSDDRQLWWRDGKIGDRLVLEFPVEKGGRYRITANLTKAVDYAIIKLKVGDQPAGPFDRYHQTVKHDPLELGLFDLPRGKSRLTVEIVGMNERGVERHMFGIDYLKLEPVQKLKSAE